MSRRYIASASASAAHCAERFEWAASAEFLKLFGTATDGFSRGPPPGSLVQLFSPIIKIFSAPFCCALLTRLLDREATEPETIRSGPKAFAKALFFVGALLRRDHLGAAGQCEGEQRCGHGKFSHGRACRYRRLCAAGS